MSTTATRPLLKAGSRGPDVVALQEQLAIQLNQQLTADGIFGNITLQAVRQFQRSQWLVVDGDAGPCTWAALLGTERYNKLHRIKLIPQQDRSACWLAATSMLFGRSTQIDRRSVPASLLASDGGLLNDSELNQQTHVEAYASHFNLRMYYPQSWSASGLADVLKFGPVATHILWNATGYVNGTGSSGHFAVIAGIRGDGTAIGTTLRIYDPWPPGTGNIQSFGYQKLMANTPALTYNLFQKN